LLATAVASRGLGSLFYTLTSAAGWTRCMVIEGDSNPLGSPLVWCGILTLYSSPALRKGLCGMRTDRLLRLGRAARREELPRIKTDNWFIIPLTSPRMAQIRSLQRSVSGLGYPQRTFFIKLLLVYGSERLWTWQIDLSSSRRQTACILLICLLMCSRTLGCS
jgi:hypothetical protein